MIYTKVVYDDYDEYDEYRLNVSLINMTSVDPYNMQLPYDGDIPSKYGTDPVIMVSCRVDGVFAPVLMTSKGKYRIIAGTEEVLRLVYNVLIGDSGLTVDTVKRYKETYDYQSQSYRALLREFGW